MKCEVITQTLCTKRHNQSWKCHEGPPPSCIKCEKETKDAQERQRKALEDQRLRKAQEQAHLKKISEIDAEIASVRQKLNDDNLARERKDVLKQKLKYLESVKKLMSLRLLPTLSIVPLT